MLDKLIDFLLNFLDLFRFWTICAAEHRGFIRRFGQPVREMRPGFNLLLPFNIETATHVDMRTWTDVLPAQSLRTKDGVEVVIRLMVSYQVEDPRTFVLKIFDATNNVQDIAAGALGAAVSAATAAQLDSGLVLRRVRAAVGRAAKSWGVAINRVQLADHTHATSIRLFGATKDES